MLHIVVCCLIVFNRRLTFLLVTRYFLLVTRCFFTHYSLLFTRYILLVTRYILLVTRYFLLVTRCFFTRYSLLIAFLLEHVFNQIRTVLNTLLGRVLELRVNTCHLNVRPFHTKISSDLRYCIVSNYSISSIVWI